MVAMSPSTSSLLIDTNVWLDFFLGFRPGHEHAVGLFNESNEADVSLLYAVTSTKDVFFLISSDFKREARRRDGYLDESAAHAAEQAAWACLESMASIATAVGCDQSDVWVARKHRPLHGDYEDDLVIAAARRSKAGCLVTNDERLLRHSPVAALSPADARALLRA